MANIGITDLVGLGYRQFFFRTDSLFKLNFQGPLLHPWHQRDQHPHEGGEQPDGGNWQEEGLVGGRPQFQRLLAAAEAHLPEPSL